MKILTLTAACALIAGITGSCFLAAENSTAAPLNPVQALLSNAHAGALHKVSCNVNDEDKQAYCMRACEEAYIAAAESYSESQEQRTSLRKECETKCGC